MHKKSIRLFISTLLLSLTVLVGGCGNASNASDTNTEYSRFSSEETYISGDAKYHFRYSFIITDNETGKQYLYLYYSGDRQGGPAMIELGTTKDVTNIDK